MVAAVEVVAGVALRETEGVALRAVLPLGAEAVLGGGGGPIVPRLAVEAVDELSEDEEVSALTTPTMQTSSVLLPPASVLTVLRLSPTVTVGIAGVDVDADVLGLVVVIGVAIGGACVAAGLSESRPKPITPDEANLAQPRLLPLLLLIPMVVILLRGAGVVVSPRTGPVAAKARAIRLVSPDEVPATLLWRCAGEDSVRSITVPPLSPPMAWQRQPIRQHYIVS